MEEFFGIFGEFFKTYGLELSLIAVLSVIVLGLMKSFNLFERIEEGKRHALYIVISVGLSFVASVIYLIVKGSCTVETLCGLAISLFAMNQAVYATGKALGINDFLAGAIKFKKLLKENKEEQAE